MHSDIVVPMSEKTLEASQHLCSTAISSAEKRNVIIYIFNAQDGGYRDRLNKRLWRRRQCSYDIDGNHYATHFKKYELNN